ncbi:MAG TPA: YXWGXW repeat-containing protein [Chitinophagaceae bacterium]|nr:YXWGXW repeat-containing protein [Chitinophagaceae bacterium]
MKKNFSKVLFVFAIAMGMHFTSGAQMYVKVRPAETVVVTRPPAPSARHIWIEGEWVWRGGAYVREPGRWVLPKRGYVWVPGHWKSTRRGWYWIPGHWRRGR